MNIKNVQCQNLTTIQFILTILSATSACTTGSCRRLGLSDWFRGLVIEENRLICINVFALASSTVSSAGGNSLRKQKEFLSRNESLLRCKEQTRIFM